MAGMEAAQAQYEELRRQALLGCAPRRGWRRAASRAPDWRGCWPCRPRASFHGLLVGAARPRWSGHADPREDALRDVYAFLLAGLAAAPGDGRCAGEGSVVRARVN